MIYVSGISIIRIALFSISAVFLILSTLVTIAALRIPASHSSSPYGITVLKSEKPLLTDEDIVTIRMHMLEVQEAKRAMRTELQAAAEKKEAKKPKVLIVLSGGDFLPGQSQLNQHAVKSVETLIPDILSVPNYRVAIEGHTDKTPVKLSPAKKYTDNMELSYLRAKTVALVLTKKGVPLDRISTIGYGDSRPIAPNDTDEGRSTNRRVEVKLMPEGD